MPWQHPWKTATGQAALLDSVRDCDRWVRLSFGKRRHSGASRDGDGGGPPREPEAGSLHVRTCEWTCACDRRTHRLTPAQTPSRAWGQGLLAPLTGALLVGMQPSPSRMALDRWLPAPCPLVPWKPSFAEDTGGFLVVCSLVTPWYLVLCGREQVGDLPFLSRLFRKDWKRVG